MENFQYVGHVPSETLRFKATRAWERIQERAPSDARIVAKLERVGDVFHCVVEIGSLCCPLAVDACHRMPEIALDKAELSVLRKLDRWCSGRFAGMEGLPSRERLGLGA